MSSSLNLRCRQQHSDTCWSVFYKYYGFAMDFPISSCYHGLDHNGASERERPFRHEPIAISLLIGCVRQHFPKELLALTTIFVFRFEFEAFFTFYFCCIAISTIFIDLMFLGSKHIWDKILATPIKETRHRYCGRLHQVGDSTNWIVLNGAIKIFPAYYWRSQLLGTCRNNGEQLRQGLWHRIYMTGGCRLSIVIRDTWGWYYSWSTMLNLSNLFKLEDHSAWSKNLLFLVLDFLTSSPFHFPAMIDPLFVKSTAKLS